MAFRLLIALVILFTFSGGALLGQPCNIPPPSSDCYNTPILCSIDELDGYCGSMSPEFAFVPNLQCWDDDYFGNAHFYAFYAGCTSFELTVIPTNCIEQNGQLGIKAAIIVYEGDGFCVTEDMPIEADIACSSIPCFTTPQTLYANNLIIGKIYYLLLYGCGQSYCDVEFVLNTPCGGDAIGPWPQSIQGPQDVCLETFAAYSIQAPYGASQFHWYLDGNLIQDGPQDFIETTWSEEGTYELCVDVSNSCTSEMDGPEPTCIFIEVSEIELTITGDNFICEGGSTILDAGPEFETYSWSTGETTQSISVNQPGSYSVFVTDNRNCTGFGEIIINNYPMPIALASSNSPVCKNATITLSASGGDSYQWSGPNGFNSTAQNPSIPNAGLVHEGIYEVIVTNSDGCTASNETTVAITENLFPVIIGPNNYCAGGISILQVAPIYATYLWSTGDTTAQINVNMAGTFTIFVTDTSGCTGIDTFVVTVGQTIYPIITGDSVLCDGMTGTLNVDIGNASYEWNNGDTTQSISVSNSGIYSVIVTDTTGCSGIDSIVVSTEQSPIGVTTSNSPICISQSILLQASGGTTYQWSGPEGFQSTLQNPALPNTTLANAGTYIVTVTNSSGCSDVDSTVVIIEDGYVLSASVILPPCEGDTLFLFATGGNDYVWGGPNGFNSTQQNPYILNAGPQHNGSYIVTDPNAPVCVVNDTLLVAIPPRLNPMITGNFNICLDDEATLDAGSGFDIYLWSTGETGQTISVNDAGTYWVVVTNAMGCSGQDTVTVEVTTDLNPTISGNLDVCIGDSSILNAGSGYASYLWNTGDTVQVITVDNSGEYSVYVTNANGCEGRDTIQFKIWDNPQVNFIVESEKCRDSCDGQISLVPFEQGYEYYWSTGNTSEIIQQLCSGNYQVTVTNPGGCFVLEDAFVPAGVELEVSISDNDSLLIVIASGGLMPYTYLWSNGDTLQSIPKTPGMYTVEVTEAGGCVQSATILITQLEDITKKGRGIILYPNPTEGTLFISPLENKVFDVTLEYQIFNALGSIVSQGVILNGSSLLNVNTSSWPAGRYVVQLVNEGGEMEVIPIVVVH